MGQIAGSPVRGEWLYETARLSQQILCEVLANGPADVAGAIALLPAPRNPLERLIRQGLIFEVLLGCVADGSHSHEEREISVMRRLLETSGRPAALQDSPECRAAALIRKRAAHPIEVRKIARIVGCHETRLRRSFRARYNMCMREFHTRCRVARAIAMFAKGETKSVAVARSLGYQSDKNFYRALRSITGQTPTELKSMPERSLRLLARDMLCAIDVPSHSE